MVSIVYLVAGMSSRFNGNVKQMAKVGPNNETLIQYSVDEALNNPFNKLIFVTNPNTEHLFKNIFGYSYKNTPVYYIEQKYDKLIRTRPWGTTDAICSIYGIIDEPFIMVNGDDIYGIKTFKMGYELLYQNDKNIIGCVNMNKSLPLDDQEVNRAVIYCKEGIVTNMKEMLKISRKKNPELLSQYGNVNFIGLQPNILDHLYSRLLEFKNLHKNDNSIECLLPDSLDELIQENKLKLEYFEIPCDILGVTHPGDEIKVKSLLSKN